MKLNNQNNDAAAAVRKSDFLQTNSFNFIEMEKLNSELEHEKNYGKIDIEFYRYFDGGEKRLVDEKYNSEKKEALNTQKKNLKVNEIRTSNNIFYIPLSMVIIVLTAFCVLAVATYKMIQFKTIEYRRKFVPAIIKKETYHHQNDQFTIEILKRNVNVRVDNNLFSKQTATMISRTSTTDLSGKHPKKYVSTCYIKPKPIPVWYTESLLLFIGSTKRKYTESIYVKNKNFPYYWSENMTTEINFPPIALHKSEKSLPIELQGNKNTHYMSLEPQQLVSSEC